MKEAGAFDAKTKLAEILREVEEGQRYTIMKDGKPVADLVPSREAARLRTAAAVANILKAKKHKLTDKELDELKQAGRR